MPLVSPEPGLEVDFRDFSPRIGVEVDNAADFTRAIMQVSAAGGGKLNVPRGLIYLSMLTGADNVLVSGQGKATILKKGPGSTLPQPIIKAENEVAFGVENLLLDGNVANLGVGAPRGQGQAWEGVNLINCQECWVQRVWIKDFDNEGIDIDNGESVLVDTVFGQDVGGALIHPSNGQGGGTFNRSCVFRNIHSLRNGLTYDRGAFCVLDGVNYLLDGLYSYQDKHIIMLDGARDHDGRMVNVFGRSPTAYAARILTGVRGVHLQMEVDGLASGVSGLWTDGAATDRDLEAHVKIKNAVFGSVPIRLAGFNWHLYPTWENCAAANLLTTVAGAWGTIHEPSGRGDGTNRALLLLGSGTRVVNPDLKNFLYGIYPDAADDIQVSDGEVEDCTHNIWINNSSSKNHSYSNVRLGGAVTNALRKVGNGHTVTNCPPAASTPVAETVRGWYYNDPGVSLSSAAMTRVDGAFMMPYNGLLKMGIGSDAGRAGGQAIVQVKFDGVLQGGVSAFLGTTGQKVNESITLLSCPAETKVELVLTTTPDWAPAGSAKVKGWIGIQPAAA